jgi:acylglycerol lipase
LQGGYHELQNEPDGVKERLAEEIIGFVYANTSQAAAAAAPESEAAKPNL